MRTTFTSLTILLALGACGQADKAPTESVGTETAAVETFTQAQIEAESARLNEWFEAQFESELAFSPLQQTFLGRDTDQGKVDDFSIEAQDASLERSRVSVAELRSNFNYDKLTPEAKTSYDIWIYQASQGEAATVFRSNGYIFEQMGAIHGFPPQLLIAFQVVEDGEDMDNYLSRISGFAIAIDELIEQSKANAATGVRPPYFSFETVIDESQKIIAGAPFSETGEDSAIWANAKSRIAGLLENEAIDQEKADQLTTDIEAALLNDWQPAYERLIAWQKEDQVNAGAEAQGVGALPNGQAYYNERLANQTTTSLTAHEIHEIGLSEVARLRADMELIKTEFGFDGTLPEFFTYLRDTKDDERLYYPNTDEGRLGYIEDATAAIDKIKAQLPNYFGILPKADLEVKRVEEFREQAGAAQHYFPGTPDGSRSGTYYAPPARYVCDAEARVGSYRLS